MQLSTFPGFFINTFYLINKLNVGELQLRYAF